MSQNMNMPGVFFIKEENKYSLNRPSDQNQLYYSELQQWYTENAFRSFSLKYVVEGEIQYHVGQKEYRVGSGQLLLTPRQQGARAYFDSREMVKSICIDICPRSMDEAFTVIKQSQEPQLENYEAGYFDHPHFYERKLRVEDSLLNPLLTELLARMKGCGEETVELDEEWFFRLAETVVLQERPHFLSLQSLDIKRPSTRKENYERLIYGRQFIESHFLQNPEISQVARACHLSAFHFFRNFRRSFGITPYQYMMNLRIDCAAGMIRDQKASISEIAAHCGFPDVQSFSKAFRKIKGIAPSRYGRANQ